MEPRAHHVLIGLFMLVAGLAAVFFFLWLARAHQQERVEYYRVVFNEPVRGLTKGSAVLYNGIRIGEVSSLELDVSDLRKAFARIAIDADIPVRRDTEARLVLTGITGTSVIELSGGSPMSPLLALPLDETDPVIVAAPSPLNQLLSGGDSLMSSVGDLITRLTALLSPDNIRHFSGILSSLDSFAADLADEGGRLAELHDDLHRLSGQATVALEQAGELMGNANILVQDGGAKALQRAGDAMAALDRAASALVVAIQENRTSVRAGTQGLTELGPTLLALRNTLGGIQEVVRRLEDNPAGYLLGSEQLREFQP